MDFKTWLESNWQHFPRQKMFPFMHDPGYNRKGASFLNKDEIDDEAFKPDNIYHVTTNLQGVLQSGGLKPRSQLNTIGLGGGWKNEAPHSISATYQYSRALQIYREFKHVLNIVAGKVKASEIWSNFLSDYPYSSFDDSDENSPIKHVIDNYVSPEIIANEYEGAEEYLDATLKTPRQRYEFFQRLEEAFVEDAKNDNEFNPQEAIGFTGTFSAMKQINPSQLAILQLAVKKDAPIYHQPHELEIRFRPEDVVVVRYLQPI